MLFLLYSDGSWVSGIIINPLRKKKKEAYAKKESWLCVINQCPCCSDWLAFLGNWREPAYHANTTQETFWFTANGAFFSCISSPDQSPENDIPSVLDTQDWDLSLGLGNGATWKANLCWSTFSKISTDSLARNRPFCFFYRTVKMQAFK